MWIRGGFGWARGGRLFSDWGCAVSDVGVLQFRIFLVEVSVWVRCGFRKWPCTVSVWACELLDSDCCGFRVRCLVSEVGLLWLQSGRVVFFKDSVCCVAFQICFVLVWFVVVSEVGFLWLQIGFIGVSEWRCVVSELLCIVSKWVCVVSEWACVV